MSRFEAVSAFVDAATIVCDYANDVFGLFPTLVLLQSVAGPAVLSIDNSKEVTDELRRELLSRQYWEMNPLLQRLREELTTTGSDAVDFAAFHEVGRRLGYSGPERYIIALPLLGPRGWFGTVMCGHTEPFSRELERNAAMLVTFLATWCAHHGIAAVPEIPGLPLGNRRMHAARLAARGLTNPEIAEQLAISTNTVKAHLKHVYERLGARSRLELVELLRSLAPLEDVPAGITRRARVTITRSPPVERGDTMTSSTREGR